MGVGEAWCKHDGANPQALLIGVIPLSNPSRGHWWQVLVCKPRAFPQNMLNGRFTLVAGPQYAMCGAFEDRFMQRQDSGASKKTTYHCEIHPQTRLDNLIKQKYISTTL